ncbi:hypothetical protein GCM10015535_42040 [Streptomyces gelaticus]|uniref:Isochorismatase family protein n=1 Tax=Streptomyces gelaticus TaxID=285446 RepID=A0ABQ2W588_9ACTN|nr:hypothetical protein GCM10015535_42040 [Streptomyces gelaticus]
MFFIDTIEIESLGNRHGLAGGAQAAVAVDAPCDSDRVIGAAARRGVRITYVVETHLRNDCVTGGPEPTRFTDAACLVPPAATGAPSGWLRPGEAPASFRRTVFAGRQRPA